MIHINLNNQIAKESHFTTKISNKSCLILRAFNDDFDLTLDKDEIILKSTLFFKTENHIFYSFFRFLSKNWKLFA